MNRRIFIGFDNSAGYGTRLLKGLKKVGVRADLFLPDYHPFKFEDSNTIILKKYKSIWMQRIYKRYFFLKCLLKYNAFIFISVNTFLKNNNDLKILRLFKKRTLMIFVGCDVQQPELTYKSYIPYSSCHECTTYKIFVGCVPETKPIRTRRLEKLVDYIMTDRALSENIKRDSLHINQPINIEDFDYNLKSVKNNPPIIFHAPSNPEYKGTKYFIKAVDELKKNYQIESKLILNVPIQKLYEEILNSDIVVDQLIQGWYGLLPLEAMMLKKPVVCYLRDDVIKKLPEDCPIINANPSNLYSVLKNLMDRKNEWEIIGEAGKKYVEKYHDAKKIAKIYSDLLIR